MKTLVLALVYSLIFVPQEPTTLRSANPDVRTKYDRFADETSVVGALGPLDGAIPSMRMVLLTSFKGHKPVSSEPSITIVLTSRSSDWEFLKATPILKCILNDSDRLTLGEMKRVGSEVVRGGVIEQLAVELPLKTMQQLATANTVEMQVWRTEFKLSKNQQETIKDYIRVLNNRVQ